MPLAVLPDLFQIKKYFQHWFHSSRNGHGVHSPFAYSLCEEVFYNSKPFYEFETLERLRFELLHNNSELEISDLGAGSKHLRSNKRKIKDIAAKGISSHKQSQILFRLINYFHFTCCLELGTSLGLNTMYMAMAQKKGEVHSLEGSGQLLQFAKALAKQHQANNIRFYAGNFDLTLPQVLNTLPRVDLAYIDGNHSFDATLRYFHLLLEKIHSDSVLVFDDIYWSRGMAKAWEEIKQHPKVTLSIDTFYSGYVFFKSELKNKQDTKIRI